MTDPDYDLTLFVNGASDLSSHAVADVRTLCDAHVGGHCELAVIDIHEDPAAALRSQVLAVPTLVKNLPLPPRRLVGDLSDPAKVRLALELV
jgi:circadian clock protein KaiB